MLVSLDFLSKEGYIQLTLAYINHLRVVMTQPPHISQEIFNFEEPIFLKEICVDLCNRFFRLNNTITEHLRCSCGIWPQEVSVVRI